MKRNDFDLIAEQYTKLYNEALTWADDDAHGKNPTPGLDDGDEGNIYEKLQAFMEYHPETVEFLSALLNEFEAIMTDINDLEAEDGKIDAADLGIHLARLAPDTTKGSAL